MLSIAQPDGGDASLLIMPAWVPGESIGVKVVAFFPGNAAKDRPTINVGYLLLMATPARCRRRWTEIL